MQQVLFSWLVVGVLHETPERVGVAQLSIVLPSLLFLLVGGAAADRADRRRMLAFLHTGATVLVLGLAAAVATGVLSFPLLVGYGLVLGSIAAFVVPTRDSLVNDVAGRNLLRAVVGATIAQFLANGLGSLGGGIARYIGTAETLAIQAAILVFGALAAYGLPRSLSRANTPETRVELSQVLAGVREVWHSPVLRVPWLLVVSIGLFFAGPYAVVFPILVRDYYGGGVGQLSVLMTTFPIGSVLASLVLLGRGRVRRKGLALVVSQALAAVSLAAIGLGLPFAAAVVAAVAWGVCGGVFINAGRTLFQEHAPPTHRARVLSVYNLGLMGGSTLGSPLAGVAAGALGPLGAFVACSVAMLAVVGAAALFTNVRTVE